MSNLINKDKMSGLEFQRIINENAIDKTTTEEQYINGRLTIKGALSAESLTVGNVSFTKDDNSTTINSPSMYISGSLTIQDENGNSVFEIKDNIIKAKQLRFTDSSIVIDETGIYRTDYNNIYSKYVKTEQSLVEGAISLSYNDKICIYIGSKTDDKFTNFNKNTFVLLNDRGDTNKIALGINPLHDESNNEISLRDSLVFDIIDSDNTLKTYHIYGDHNNQFYPPTGALFIKYDNEALDYDSEKGEKGLQIIGTDIASQASNAVYLRSINKDVVEPTTSENMSTLWVKSPKDAKNNDIDITERFVFQSGSDSIYKIWGEHNLKRVLLKYTEKNNGGNNEIYNNTKEFFLSSLGIDFSPKIIKVVMYGSFPGCSGFWEEKDNSITNHSTGGVSTSYRALTEVIKTNNLITSFKINTYGINDKKSMCLVTFYGGEV